MMPISRPSRRWMYSHQNIDLNSARPKCECCSLNSGNCLYCTNLSIQSRSLSGGIVPPISLQSTIESPDSVSRVMPPITTIAAIRAQPVSSQARTCRSWYRCVIASTEYTSSIYQSNSVRRARKAPRYKFEPTCQNRLYDKNSTVISTIYN